MGDHLLNFSGLGDAANLLNLAGAIAIVLADR